MKMESVSGKWLRRPVLVGLIPQAVVLDAGDQVSWISDAGNLRVEFDVNRWSVYIERVSSARRDAAAERPAAGGDQRRHV